MDIGDLDNGGDISGGFDEQSSVQKRPRALPDDLPKSLDDRRNVPSHFTQETEMYDAWQGMSRAFLLPPPSQSLNLI
jgi:hypothetical protein